MSTSSNTPGAITWEQSNVQRIMSRQTCLVADFVMCAFGKKSLSGDGYFQKSTRVITISPNIHKRLHGKRCPGNHKHVLIQGSELGQKRSHRAQIYPRQLCDALASR